MARTRQKPTDKIRGIAAISDIAYNEQAGANKIVGPIVGKLRILGAANTLKKIDPGATVAFYNNSATTAWVAIGQDATPPSAPTGGADGIALKPNDYTILALGNNNCFIANAATVFAYEVEDDSKWQ